MVYLNGRGWIRIHTDSERTLARCGSNGVAIYRTHTALIIGVSGCVHMRVQARLPDTHVCH